MATKKNKNLLPVRRPKNVDEYGLNDRQRKFAELCASGSSAMSAYIAVYGNSSSAQKNASRLREKEGICRFIEGVQRESRSDRVLTKQQADELLSEIAKNPESQTVAVQAVRQLSRQSGWEVTRIVDETPIDQAVVIMRARFNRG